ncbi:1-phosphatidylinositol 4-kinase LSB6 [Sporobolomyces salmoneus]|uniref:1-phosphatidylinositol 4-kinase LSB6 n=1 Tax=Sporobolomyces salmoneus TaxID=183962 RepID=UPI0031820898
MTSSTSSTSPAPPSASDTLTNHLNELNSPPSGSTAQHVDDLFQKWTRYVSHKLKHNDKSKKGNGQENLADGLHRLDLRQAIPVQRSVFVAQTGENDANEELKEEEERAGQKKGKEKETRFLTLNHRPPLSHEEFLELVAEARRAISLGIHPRLNSKGSSGSYFVRDSLDSTTLGIFKPSDEDPYGAMNPKLLKWLHRSLHHLLPRIVPFGRSCLIPGQSYLSEAAASTLDRKLESWIVPRTEVVGLRSEAFYYDRRERERAKKEGKELREKDGSFQVFLKGFTDASEFFSKYPYPPTSRSASTANPRNSSLFSSCLPCCSSPSSDRFSDDSTATATATSSPSAPEFEWTREMVESFQLELEKLVILDYLIRNTDRGLDNFMIKPCIPSSASLCPSPSPSSLPEQRPHLHIAAIDNSLAFPHTHPQGWRSFPYGWLYLPLQLLDNPWSPITRSHYLEKLEDPLWWSQLHRDLREEFRQNRDWTEEDETLWKKQWSVVKGQGWNLVRSLKATKEGPLELCRRRKVLVWDEYVLVSEKEEEERSVADDSGLPTPLSTPLSTNDHSASSISVSYSRASDTSTPKPPPLSHRRTLSDYTSNYGSTSLTLPRPGLGRTTSTDRRTASFLRKPLDSLASPSPKKRPFKNLLLQRHSSSSSASDSAISRLQATEEGMGDMEKEEEEEEEEETGFSFLKKLDKLEKSEEKRARKVEKEAKKLGLLEGEAKPSPRSQNAHNRGGSVDERSRLLGAASEDEEDEEDEAVEGGWGTTSEIILNGNGKVGARDRGRVAMSWYHQSTIDGVLVEAAEREAEGTAAERKKRWVVHERLEYVQEPKRRLRLPW